MNNPNWQQWLGKRLLLGVKHAVLERNEWTLLEVSPSGEVGKFRNEIGGTMFWRDLDALRLLEVLPAAGSKGGEQ